MAEYIKREDVKTAIRERFKSLADRVEINTIVNMMPRIDIVRCKECRHWCNHKDVDYDQSKFTYYCEVHGISFEGDEFCSYGEREGE